MSLSQMLPPRHDLEIYQTWGQAIGYSKNIVCKIFDEHIGDGVRPVN